jgi:hypothetical protein
MSVQALALCCVGLTHTRPMSTWHTLSGFGNQHTGALRVNSQVMSVEALASGKRHGACDGVLIDERLGRGSKIF